MKRKCKRNNDRKNIDKQVQAFHSLSLCAQVFPGNPQHTKTFTVLLIQMFMMHLMRPPDTSYIRIIAPGKKLYSLVNYYIMYHEICKTVHGYARTYGGKPGLVAKCAKQNAEDARNREYQEKHIIFFKKTVTFLMMVFMQIP